jgi:predicted nucleic acid-binding protein
METYSTFRRLLIKKAINEDDYKILLNEFEIDCQFYTHIDFNEIISVNAKLLIEKYQLKTIDSIQLGTALLLKDQIDYVVVSDEKIIKSGKTEGLKVINPMNIK